MHVAYVSLDHTLRYATLFFACTNPVRVHSRDVRSGDCDRYNINVLLCEKRPFNRL